MAAEKAVLAAAINCQHRSKAIAYGAVSGLEDPMHAFLGERSCGLKAMEKREG